MALSRAEALSRDETRIASRCGILVHATVRSPLLPLERGAEQEIHAATSVATLSKVAWRI